MQLDSPPLFANLLFEAPWPLMAALVIVSVAFSFAARQKRSKPLLAVSVAALLLSAGVYVLAMSVTTEREKLLNSTRELIASTSPLDSQKLDRLIDPSATVSGPDGTAWLTYEQIGPRLKSVVGRFGVQSQRVRDLQALTHEGDWGESSVLVRTEASGAGGMPINTGWYLTWQKSVSPGAGADSGGTWRVVDIRWMRFNGQEVSRGMLP